MRILHPALARIAVLPLLVALAACGRGHGGQDRGSGTGAEALVAGSPADLTVGERVRVRMDDASYPYVATLVEIADARGHHGHRGDKGWREGAKGAPGEETAEGAVTELDAARGAFKVLGLDIVVDGETAFDGASGVEDLSDGRFVAVRGSLEGDGVFHASRVRVAGAELSGDVIGVVPTTDGVKIDVLGRTILVTSQTEVLRPAPDEKPDRGR